MILQELFINFVDQYIKISSRDGAFLSFRKSFESIPVREELNAFHNVYAYLEYKQTSFEICHKFIYEFNQTQNMTKQELQSLAKRYVSIHHGNMTLLNLKYQSSNAC